MSSKSHGLRNSLLTTVPLGIVVMTYFYFKFDIPEFITWIFFATAVIGFTLDVRITVTNAKYLHHELNLVFPFIYKRLGPLYGSITQFLVVDCMIILLTPILFTGELHYDGSAVVAVYYGTLHTIAYFCNKRTVKSLT